MWEPVDRRALTDAPVPNGPSTSDSQLRASPVKVPSSSSLPVPVNEIVEVSAKVLLSTGDVMDASGAWFSSLGLSLFAVSLQPANSNARGIETERSQPVIVMSVSPCLHRRANAETKPVNSSHGHEKGVRTACARAGSFCCFLGLIGRTESSDIAVLKLDGVVSVRICPIGYGLRGAGVVTRVVRCSAAAFMGLHSR